MLHEALTRAIIGCAMIVHRRLGPGFLESVYQNALAWELGSAGIAFECERRLAVRYRDAIVGEFVADMVVGGVILIENKAVGALSRAHEVQLVNYLAATGIEIGLLINFGGDRLAIKRKVRAQRGTATAFDRITADNSSDNYG